MTEFPPTVIIPAYNAALTIAGCIEALLTQEPDLPEIIVADDGSTDQTAAIVGAYEQRGVRLLRLPHGGAGAARNAGIAAATGELLLFTDADCAPAPDWVTSFVKAFEAEPDLAAAKGVYRTRQKAAIPRFIQAEYADRYRRMARAATIDFVDTYAAAYRRGVLQTETFDPRYPGAIVEDAELAYRLAERGLYMKFVPEAVVYHQHVNTLSRYFRRKFKIGFWRVAVYKRHPTKLRGDSHTPQVAKLQMLLVTLSLLMFGIGGLLKIGKRPRSGRAVWQIALISNGLYNLSTLPFIWRTWQSDKIAALIAPLMLLVRAVALASGAIAGVAKLFLRDKLS